MNKYLQLPSILMCVLSLPVCFMIGAFLPSLTGSVENNGMAGGATVVMSGVIAALIGLIASIAVIYHCPTKTIRYINWALVALLLILVGIVFWRMS